MSDYKRNPRGARRARKSMGRKAIVVLSLMMVLVMAAAGGTIAWLMDRTDPVVNTFTVGNVDIDLTEEAGKVTDSEGKVSYQFKMVPGNTIAKDPKVTVEAGSEACWLFVKVVESDNLGKFISYTVDSGWTKLTTVADVTGVYYRVVDATAAAAGVTYDVLTDNTVTVKNTVLKSDMEALQVPGATQPTLTFTAYACQKDNIATVEEAWAAVQANGVPTT